MDIEIKKLSSQDLDDFTELIKIFEVVFEMDNFKMPGNKHLQSLLSKPDCVTLVAKCDNKVLNKLTTYILHSYYSAKPIVYIYDIGVSAGYQRKGIGTKLVTYLTNFCKENGFEEAYVEAESDDAQAISFYRTTSFSNELQATHFTYSFGERSMDNSK